MSERVPSEKKCEKVACKHCGKEFAYILKHLANVSICKSVYQEDELNSLRLFSKSISDANKKIKAWNNYKSEDRAKKYKTEKHKVAKKYQKIKHKVAENYYLDGLVKDQVELNKDESDERIDCQCKQSFSKNSILKHVANSTECKNYYKMPSSKAELKIFQITSKNESKRKKREKLKHEKEQERLRVRRESILHEKSCLAPRLDKIIKHAKEINLDGMNCAKQEFEFEFERFKEMKMPNKLQDKITTLQSSIHDTFKMFELDIANLSKIAETVIGEVCLDFKSIRKCREYINDLYKPLDRRHTYTNKCFYTIREDWHDTRLKIDLELNEIAQAIRVPFQWKFSCTWVLGVCPKCTTTKSNQKCDSAIIRNRINTAIITSKSKPINENDGLEEYMEK